MMQQLLYKYLVLNNRLNIPSLGSFSVSYAPAQYNPQDGSLLPKQPILHFKDGPPATADTRLLPFLAAELNMSQSAAANELLNFSLQVMTELVENKRAQLKGIGTLSKDGFGKLHFVQENANRVIQPAMQTLPQVNTPKSANPAPTSVTDQYSQPKTSPSPIAEYDSTYAGARKFPVEAKSNLPEGKLDPTLDYASIQSYQESPDLLRVRQQIAQRREQINAEFGDLREARERMKRVHLPGQEGILPPSNRISATGATPNPFAGNSPTSGSENTFPERLNRSNDPLPRTRSSSIFGKSDYPPLIDPIEAARNSPFDNTQKIPGSNYFTPNEESFPKSKQRWNLPGQGFDDSPTQTPTPETVESSDPLTVRMPKRNWHSTERPFNATNNRVDSNQSNILPTIGKAGRIGVREPMDANNNPRQTTGQTLPAKEQAATSKWPWQKIPNLPSVSFPKPAKIAKEEEVTEEKEQRPGFLGRLKAAISRLLKKKEIVKSDIQAERPQVEGKKVSGMITKATAKLVEIKNNEFDTSGELKKDYWWVYSIGLAFVATIAIIIHMF